MLDKETLQAIFEQRVADINRETLKETGGSAEGFYFTRINESMVKMDERRPINEASIAASTVARLPFALRSWVLVQTLHLSTMSAMSMMYFWQFGQKIV